MKKTDLKSKLTILIITALIVYIGYILFKIEITTEIAVMFISAFIVLANNIANYYFNRKQDGKGGE